MPFTPYHFGPSGFIGLVFRKWIDIPVFVLANVIVDVEVLVIMIFGLGWPVHRYCHTLLIGAIAGALWGVAAYPLRGLLKVIMRLIHIPYQSGLRKMIVSGILGAWLHVVIDGAYHSDVRVFWPNKTVSLYQLIHPYIDKEQIKILCLVFFVAAIIPYAMDVVSYTKQNQLEKKVSDKTTG
jgi:membrane-bound metal-dependent hydrolase YbcI (DUF457 family)